MASTDNDPNAGEGPVAPQLILITPQGATTAAFIPLLAEVLDRIEVACLRIRASDDAAEMGRMADAVRDLAHARDIAVMIEDHWDIALSHGLDGVHLTSGARQLREARRVLGNDAIVGAFCGASRHAGIGAAEAGADYVSFGPVGAGAPGTGDLAPEDLFAWWSEMIEVPVVAEGNLDPALIGRLARSSDFIALGREIWAATDPAETLSSLWR